MSRSNNHPAVPVSDNLPLAIGTILVTVFALALGDALVKRFSADLTLWQIFVTRSALALPLLVILLRTGFRGVSLLPASPGWTALRSLLLTSMWVAYYMALPHVELSIAAAAYYTLPIFIVFFASLFLGEPIGRAGWLAALIGFCGVVLILKPRADDFNAYALLPIIAAILYAAAMILTRSRCRHEHPLALSLALNVSFVLVGLIATVLVSLWPAGETQATANPFLLGQWTSMGRDEWLAVLLLSAAILVGSIGAAIAYQAGPASVVATFDYAYVAFAAMWGFVLFSEVPDAVTVLGMLMIVGAGLIAVRR